ncbi:hypothetical protein OD997_11895 [Microbacterium sp. CGR1]
MALQPKLRGLVSRVLRWGVLNTATALSGVDLVRHVDVLARPDALAHTAVRRVLRALQDVAARVQRDSR